MALGETDHQALFLGTTWAMLGLALLLCGARYYVKICMMHKLTVDDIILVVTIVGAVAMMTLLTLQSKYALGRHLVNMTPDDFSIALKVFYAAAICYCIATTFAKIAIVLQYIRIFHLYPIFIWICWTILVLLVIWMLGILLAVGAFWYDDPHYWLGTYSLPCSVTELTFVFLHSKIADEPRWSPQTVGSQYQIKTWLAQSSISIVFDIFLICLPIPLVATMQAPPRQKLVILGLFAIGSAGCIISIIRIVAFLRDEKPRADPAYENIYTPLWTALECIITLICAALMAIKPLLTKWFPSLRREGRGLPTAHPAPPHDLAPMQELEQPRGQHRLNKIRTTITRVTEMVNSRTSSRVERSNPAHEDERHGSELFLAGYVHDISKDRTTEMGINAKGKEKEEVPAPLKLPEPIRRKDTNEESRKRESDRRNFRRSYP